MGLNCRAGYGTVPWLQYAICIIAKDHGKNGNLPLANKMVATKRLFCVQEILLIYGTFFWAFDLFKAGKLFVII